MLAFDGPFDHTERIGVATKKWLLKNLTQHRQEEKLLEYQHQTVFLLPTFTSAFDEGPRLAGLPGGLFAPCYTPNGAANAHGLPVG